MNTKIMHTNEVEYDVLTIEYFNEEGLFVELNYIIPKNIGNNTYFEDPANDLLC